MSARQLIIDVEGALSITHEQLARLIGYAPGGGKNIANIVSGSRKMAGAPLQKLVDIKAAITAETQLVKWVIGQKKADDTVTIYHAHYPRFIGILLPDIDNARHVYAEANNITSIADKTIIVDGNAVVVVTWIDNRLYTDFDAEVG